MRMLAIDPGPTRSAIIEFINPDIFGVRSVGAFLLAENETILDLLRSAISGYDLLVIEKVESFGMAVGAEVFETVYWTGQFVEAARTRTVRIGRKEVKLTLCGSPAAKDPNIRQALIDRFGGSSAIGTKAAPGPLYGVSKDVWSALAVGVTAIEKGEHLWTPPTSETTPLDSASPAESSSPSERPLVSTKSP